MAEGLKGCTECRRLEDKWKIRHSSKVTFMFHLPYLWDRDKASKENRFKARENLHQIVSAVQNTDRGGYILIHFPDQTEGDRFLGYFDEFITRIFPNVTEDGDLSTDIFSRKWLSDEREFINYSKFVILSLKPLSYVSTVEYNTKVRNDLENTEPSTRCMLACLTKPDIPEKEPQIKGLSDDQYMHENRNIELKGFIPGIDEITSPFSVAEYIWYKLKLRDNLTSISKLREGGSFYVGISEKEIKLDKRRSKILELEGFQMIFKMSDLQEALKNLAESHLLLLDAKGGCNDAPSNLFHLELHPVSSSRNVLEIAIRHVNGLLFYDKRGPRAYKVIGNSITRMNVQEWYSRLKEWGEPNLRI